MVSIGGYMEYMGFFVSRSSNQRFSRDGGELHTNIYKDEDFLGYSIHVARVKIWPSIHV